MTQHKDEFMESIQYELLDSGNGRKLEKFGPYVISRPSSQAVWAPRLPSKIWEAADAVFTRENDSKWTTKGSLPDHWRCDAAGVSFRLSPTDFGHLGIFPEQRPFWEWLQQLQQPFKILNLFAYSGGATLAAAKGGAHVCHLDASKGMVAWAKENAALNQLQNAPIRWIVDDVHKFLAREEKRNNRYDGIILDPPSFGRGTKGEIFKIEDDIQNLLRQCRSLLVDRPAFVLFSCHTPGFTPLAMKHLLDQMMQDFGGHVDTGEMSLTGKDGVLPIPSGTYARWRHEI